MRSLSASVVDEPHFDVFPEYHEASYADRYRLFCERLMRERLYDGACLLLSKSETGSKGEFLEPSKEVDFAAFADSLIGHAIAFSRSRNRT